MTIPPCEHQQNRLHFHATAALLVAAIAVVFWPLTRAQFTIWDDNAAIVVNPRFTNPSLQSLAWHWSHPWMSLYVPVTNTVWWMLARLNAGNPDPIAFHVLNMVIHALAAIVALRVLTRLTQNLAFAALGAIVFALHPIQTEAVAWGSGTKDLLAGLFCLIAIDRYVAHATTSRPRDYALTIASLIAGMLSKPSAVVTPLVLIALDLLVLRRDRRAVSRAVLPLVLLTIPCIAWSRLVQPATDITTQVPFWQRPAVAWHSFSFYLSKVIWPAQLAIDYGAAPARIISDKSWMYSWAAPFALLLLGVTCRRRVPLLLAGIVIMLLALGPMLGFLTFEFQEISNVADHYAYPAMFGVALSLAGVFHKWPRVATVLAVLLVFVLGARTNHQARHWLDSRSLFEHTLRVNPRSWNATNGLSQDSLACGDAAIAEQFARQSIMIRADNPNAYGNLGLALLAQNRRDEAIECFRQAARLNPRSNAAKAILFELGHPITQPSN